MQPGQQKISQFTPAERTQPGDIIPFVRDGQNRSITVDKFTGIVPDGWVTLAELWQFASFSNGIGVVTVPEGDIKRYPAGARVQFQQGVPKTVKYGVVMSSTSTSVTIALINGAVLENLAISDVFISLDYAPQTTDNVDFVTKPMFRAYTSRWTNLPTSVTTVAIMDTVDYNIGGMFNANTFKATVPIDGVYHIDAKCAIGSSGISTTATALMQLFRNGLVLSESQRINGSGNDLKRPIPVISGDFFLKKGDVIDVRAHCSESRNFGGDSRLSHFSMRLIDYISTS